MTQRDRYLIGGAGLMAIVAAFWLLALHPKLQNLSTAKSDLAAAQANYQTARQQAQENAQARVQFPHTYATLAKLGKAVPVNSDQASLVYQLDQAAAQSGTQFRSVSLNASGGNTAPDATPAAGTSPEDDVLGSVPADATVTAAAPAGASTGAANLRVMHYDLQFNGGFFRLENLIRNVKRLTWTRNDTLLVSGRLLTVDAVTFDSNGQKVTMSVTAYLMPAGEGLFGGATPAGPPGLAPSTQTASASSGAAVAPPAATVAP